MYVCVYIYISICIFQHVYYYKSNFTKKKKKINNNVITIMGNFNIGINYVD